MLDDHNVIISDAPKSWLGHIRKRQRVATPVVDVVCVLASALVALIAVLKGSRTTNLCKREGMHLSAVFLM